MIVPHYAVIFTWTLALAGRLAGANEQAQGPVSIQPRSAHDRETEKHREGQEPGVQGDRGARVRHGRLVARAPPAKASSRLLCGLLRGSSSRSSTDEHCKLQKGEFFVTDAELVPYNYDVEKDQRGFLFSFSRQFMQWGGDQPMPDAWVQILQRHQQITSTALRQHVMPRYDAEAGYQLIQEYGPNYMGTEEPTGVVRDVCQSFLECVFKATKAKVPGVPAAISSYIKTKVVVGRWQLLDEEIKAINDFTGSGKLSPKIFGSVVSALNKMPPYQGGIVLYKQPPGAMKPDLLEAILKGTHESSVSERGTGSTYLWDEIFASANGKRVAAVENQIIPVKLPLGSTTGLVDGHDGQYLRASGKERRVLHIIITQSTRLIGAVNAVGYRPEAVGPGSPRSGSDHATVGGRRRPAGAGSAQAPEMSEPVVGHTWTGLMSKKTSGSFHLDGKWSGDGSGPILLYWREVAPPQGRSRRPG